MTTLEEKKEKLSLVYLLKSFFQPFISHQILEVMINLKKNFLLLLYYYLFSFYE